MHSIPDAILAQSPSAVDGSALVEIRSITLGVEVSWPLPAAFGREAARFLAMARQRLEEAGFGVQTLRLCTTPPDRLLPPAELPAFARALESVCAEHGIDYCATGGIHVQGRWTEEATAAAVAASVLATERCFTSVQLVRDGRVCLPAARASASAIASIARESDQGFGNLRFAATANCPPNVPFFPSAYHGGGPPAFAVALQSADLVQAALDGEQPLEEREERLVQALSEAGQQVEAIGLSLEQQFGVRYVGLDLSPAPFPSEQASVALGLERLGVQRFGGAGSLFAAWRLTRALRRVRVRACGFSGLMLPVLEDAGLARRAAEGLVSISELLLLSSVCGTGLDTVPLPGDSSTSELTGILLDVAALSAALRKPLTARLLPVPGRRAGESTSFDFPYFVNTAVLPTKGFGVSDALAFGAGHAS